MNQRYKYLVVAVRLHDATGQSLEIELEHYARKGWRVVAVTPSLVLEHEVIKVLVTLEQEAKEP